MNQDIAGLIADRLSKERQNLLEEWQQSPTSPLRGASSATVPTRYLVVDNLLPDDLARQIYQAFPTEASLWHVRSSFRERKRTLTTVRQLSPVIQQATQAFHDSRVIQLIGQVTGTTELQADPSLYAAGLSVMSHQDFLNPHIDNSHDADKRRYRRLNLLYYVTPGWAAESGGNLELWDSRVRQCVSIAARFNRLVIMQTHRGSWHSVDPVLATSQMRCCLSNYYFSPDSPTGESYQHVTSFTGRPGQHARRAFGRVDNLCRQMLATTLGLGRGRKLLNDA